MEDAHDFGFQSGTEFQPVVAAFQSGEVEGSGSAIDRVDEVRSVAVLLEGGEAVACSQEDSVSRGDVVCQIIVHAESEIGSVHTVANLCCFIFVVAVADAAFHRGEVFSFEVGTGDGFILSP